LPTNVRTCRAVIGLTETSSRKDITAKERADSGNVSRVGEVRSECKKNEAGSDAAPYATVPGFRQFPANVREIRPPSEREKPYRTNIRSPVPERIPAEEIAKKRFTGGCTSPEQGCAGTTPLRKQPKRKQAVTIS